MEKSMFQHGKREGNQAAEAVLAHEEIVDTLPSQMMAASIRELSAGQAELQSQIEALRQAQQALEQSRKQYLELYEFAPVGYFVIEGQGRIQEANQTAASILGVA